MKPILFNTEMVRAILEGRKTATRRVVKPQPLDEPRCFHDEEDGVNIVCHVAGMDVLYNYFPPYQPGDILYVRETWGLYHQEPLFYVYKADPTSGDEFDQDPGWKWRPSIHMPKEAARIFLRVTDVRVERLQDGFPDNGAAALDLFAEGVSIPEECRTCIEAYGEPCCSDLDDDLPYDEITGEDSAGGSECGLLDEVRSEFMKLWDSTIKPADRPLYGWAADPWVWVIEFERIGKEEALAADKEGGKNHA